MGRWFNRVGNEPAPPVVPPHESPSTAGDQPKAVEKVVRTASDHRHPERLREVLRLEFECAADYSLKKGNLTAAKILWKLAGTTQQVEVGVLYAYAQLLDDIASPPVASDALRQIGSGWFPKTAAEYVDKLVLVRHADHLAVQELDK